MEADASAVAHLAHTFYKLTPTEGSITKLDGYGDVNFSFVDQKDGKMYVMKLVNPDESNEDVTDLIDEVLANSHDSIAKESHQVTVRPKLVVLKPVRTSAGRLSARADIRRKDKDGQYGPSRACNVKLFDFFNGYPLEKFIAAKWPPIESLEELYTNVGKVCGRLSGCMRTQRHLVDKIKACRERDSFHWQLITCEPKLEQWIDKFYPEKLDSEQRSLCTKVIAEFRAIKHQLGQYPEFPIHGDLHGENILLAKDEPLDNICIIDFQDLQAGQQVIELAVMMMYLTLEALAHYSYDEVKPIRRWIQHGYEQQCLAYPLSNDELSLIPVLMRMRLCQSLLVGLSALERDPSNEYIAKNRQRAWRFLKSMAEEVE